MPRNVKSQREQAVRIAKAGGHSGQDMEAPNHQTSGHQQHQYQGNLADREQVLGAAAEAVDGAAGLRAIARLAPDVALIDVRLPGLDGFSIARRVDEAGGPPVVLISAFGSPRYREAAAVAGVAGLLAGRRSGESKSSFNRWLASRSGD